MKRYQICVEVKGSRLIYIGNKITNFDDNNINDFIILSIEDGAGELKVININTIISLKIITKHDDIMNIIRDGINSGAKPYIHAFFKQEKN